MGARIFRFVLFVALLSFPITGVFLIVSLDEVITGKEISLSSQEGPSFLAVLISGVIVVGAGLAFRVISSHRGRSNTDTPSVEPLAIPSLDHMTDNQANESRVISRSEPAEVVAPIQKNKRKIKVD